MLAGVGPVVPALHGGPVECSGRLESVARTDYNNFYTCHRETPLRTVQFRPEYALDVDQGRDWDPREHPFAGVNASACSHNFVRGSQPSPDGQRGWEALSRGCNG